MLHQTINRGAIPPFETGADIVRRLASLLRPKKALTVLEWAIEHLGYDPDVLPWQPEIMNALGYPETSEVDLMGPVQCGKSEIGNAFVGWSIEHDPADFMIVQPDKALAQDYVVRRIAPMIEKTPALKAQLLPGASADNIFLKQFKGMLLTTVWPVPAQLRARPIVRGWIDDFDQIAEDIDGQGSIDKLLAGRQTSHEGRDTKFISSSPNHEKGGKIEGRVEAATDERLKPICPSCNERVELDLMRDLKFDRGSLELAEESVYVACPASGCALRPDDKRRLLDSLKGLPNYGFVAKYPERGKRRRSFRVDGLLAFTSWPKLAREWREAEIEYDVRGNEAPMRAFVNTKAGKNYRSKLSGEKPIESKTLQARRDASSYISGTVPPGVKVVTIEVDVQAASFQLLARGWGEGLENWIIRRWSIDALNDGLTQVAPFRNPEHWAVLLPLFAHRWPLADGSDGVPALCMSIDIGGGRLDGDGALLGAKAFWHMAVAAGVHRNRITLLKGGSNPAGKLMPPAQFADQKLKGGGKRNGPRLWLPNVHAIKNMLDQWLRREKPGPLFVHLPSDLADEHIDEMTAEIVEGGKWKKQRPRNETWDLLVYGYAAILRPPFAQSRTDMRWVPSDFRVKAGAPNAVPIVEPAKAVPLTPSPAAPPETAAEPTSTPTPTPTRPARRLQPKRRGSGWMGRLK